MEAAPAVLNVTAEAVRVLSGGSGRPASRALVEAALDWIDDPIGLFDERPVAVADLWRSLVVTLLGPRCESVVVVVHPPDWARSRIDRVVAAVNTVADHIEAVSADRWDGIGPSASDHPGQSRRCGRRRRWGALVLVAGVLVAGGAVSAWHRPGHRIDGPTVVEGRMAVRVPAQWHVHRVTGGPGSRRLHVASPDDPAIAVHLTWSYAPGSTLMAAVDVLSHAIAGEPVGVFSELRAGVTVAGREAVTYRESRPGRVIDWAVVQAGSTRIGIGCQSPPGRESEVRTACEDAVRSAAEK